MTFDLLAHMRDTAAEIDGVRSYVDPHKALLNRPCALVGPPVVDFGAGLQLLDGTEIPEVQTPVYALSSKPAGTLDAVKELNDVVQAIEDSLGYVRAVPITYRLTASGDPVAAYLCTVTDTEE